MRAVVRRPLCARASGPPRLGRVPPGPLSLPAVVAISQPAVATWLRTDVPKSPAVRDGALRAAGAQLARFAMQAGAPPEEAGAEEAASWDARVDRMMGKLADARAPAPPPQPSHRREQRDALRTLAAHCDGSAVPLRTLHAIVRRCLEEPDEERWRRLRLANPRVEREVVAHPGGVEFLRAAGFSPAEFGTVFVLPPLFGRPDAVRQLHTALASLQAAAAAAPGGGLQLPTVDLGPSARASVGLLTVLASDDLRRAVLGTLGAVEMWPLRLVAKSFGGWVDSQLAELRSLSVGDMLAQKSSQNGLQVPRREFALLVSRCTSLQSLTWGLGGGRATARHADALARTLAAGLSRARAPLRLLSVSGAAALSWNGLAAMLNETADPVTSEIRQLEYVAGEAASELTEAAESGEPATDLETGALLGHSSGVALAGALRSCGGLETITFAGGGGDAGPSCGTLAAMGAWCRGLQSLSLDGCISIDGFALSALVDGRTARQVLATEQRVVDGVVRPGLGQVLPPSLCPDGPTMLCSTLTSLDISGCVAMSDAGLQALNRAGIRLHALHANDCRALSDEGTCSVITPTLATLELASRCRVGDDTLCCLAGAQCSGAMTSLDISSGWGDAVPLSAAAMLQLVDGCPRMKSLRAAYATLPLKFITALGEQWGSYFAEERGSDSDSNTGGGLVHLDLSFCKVAAGPAESAASTADGRAVFCDALANALAQCVHLTTLALAGFAAMRPAAPSARSEGEGVSSSVLHPADAVIEAVLGSCQQLRDLNCSETDIGADAVAQTLLQLADQHGQSSSFSSSLQVVNFSGCRRLGGETFVALLRVCPDLRDLNLGYCCNEEHAQLAKAETRGHARAEALLIQGAATTEPAAAAAVTAGSSVALLESGAARVITDSDLAIVNNSRCAHKLRGLRLGGMGSRQESPWPTVGDANARAFGAKGIAAVASARRVCALQTVDLSHSAATNPTMLQLASAAPELTGVNVVGAKCTRELHRLLREAGCRARVFGI